MDRQDVLRSSSLACSTLRLRRAVLAARAVRVGARAATTAACARWPLAPATPAPAPGQHHASTSTSTTPARRPLALAYDLETTGLHNSPQIIQIGVIVVDDGGHGAHNEDEFEGVCLPTVDIDRRATEVHGITRASLEACA